MMGSYCGDMSSVNINPSSVLAELDQLLPLLASGPYTQHTLSMLAKLCYDLKRVGPQLDMEHRVKMDTLLSVLTRRASQMIQRRTSIIRGKISGTLRRPESKWLQT